MSALDGRDRYFDALLIKAEKWKHARRVYARYWSKTPEGRASIRRWWLTENGRRARAESHRKEWAKIKADPRRHTEHNTRKREREKARLSDPDRLERKRRQGREWFSRHAANPIQSCRRCSTAFRRVLRGQRYCTRECKRASRREKERLGIWKSRRKQPAEVGSEPE